jgi:hypothetical protein
MWKPETRGTRIMATKQKTRTYRIRREWTVVMESWIEVEADSVEAACAAARANDDYDDQRIADDSDGPTYIGRIECGGRELPVPVQFNGDGMR